MRSTNPPPKPSQSTDPDATVDWQTAMKRAIRSSAELARRLDLPEPTWVPSPNAKGPQSNKAAAENLERQFPTFVPLELLSRIRSGDPKDPILRQVIASPMENLDAEGFVSDPVGDSASRTAPGLLQKYSGRALVVTHGACAVHCRYCFRREYPYSETGSRQEHWQPAIDQIRGDQSVDEVILSGGDPLTLADGTLDRLITEIESIDHVMRLRIHSRLPIVIPQRVTPWLVQRLRQSRLAAWMVVHANHVQEIDDAVTEAFSRMIHGGIPVLNQAVLLSGVNDSVESLVDLCQALINRNVQPYYLHHLDRVQGASHFWVSQERGIELINEVRKRLPGYAVPKYVVEVPGEPSKTPIA